MSFEDELRMKMGLIDDSDREGFLKATASACVRAFKETCRSNAMLGQCYASTMAVTREPGKTNFIYAVEDSKYETAKAKGSPYPETGHYFFVKLSEAELFQAYVREEFKHQDMEKATISIEKDIRTGIKPGLFGQAKRFQYSTDRYKFNLFLSW